MINPDLCFKLKFIKKILPIVFYFDFAMHTQDIAFDASVTHDYVRLVGH